MYYIFFRNTTKTKNYYFLTTYIPFLYKPKINFKLKKVIDIDKDLYFNHFNRLYLYSRSLSYRYNNLLSEYCITDNIKLELNCDDTIIDCGANIGEFSIAMALKYNLKNFVCFEPDPSEFNVLQLNMKSYNSILVNKALSNKIGFSDFYLDNTTGDSSLLRNDNVATTKIETLTLDKFLSESNIKTVGLIKIEAEGFEPEILEGAIDSLNIIKYISVDCGYERYGNSTFEQVTNFLIKNNFSLLNFNSNRYTMLFLNKTFIKN
jgi:FkbM family methyltransferase